MKSSARNMSFKVIEVYLFFRATFVSQEYINCVELSVVLKFYSSNELKCYEFSRVNFLRNCYCCLGVNISVFPYYLLWFSVERLGVGVGGEE